MNLNFIFYLLPKLTGSLKDDQIDLHILNKYFEFNFIQLQNEQSKLLNATSTDFSRPARSGGLEARSSNEQKDIFQKKYTGPELDLNKNERKCLGNLIVCASLIGKLSYLFKINFNFNLKITIIIKIIQFLLPKIACLI